MVMMDDEQRAGDVLAGPGSAAAIGRTDNSGPGTGRDAPTPEARGGRAEDAANRGHDEDEDEDAEAEAETPRSRWSLVTEMVVLFAVALAIALLIKTFVVQPFYIPSASMENTLMVGDKVLVNKVVYRIRPVSRGDIVVFNGAGSWLPPTASATPVNHNPLARLYDATLGPFFRSVRELFGTAPGQTDYIKRVIGVPGDHVACCNAQGDITVNGVPLQEQSYLIPGARPSQGRFSIVVPPGRLWVMGDNRPESADSRLHDCAYTYEPPTCVPYDRGGTVPEDKVIGRAFMIVWPPSRFRILPIPSTFAQAGFGHASAARSDGRLPALADGATLRPSAPYLPLAGGLAAAVPITLLERRLRLRVSGLRRARRLRRKRRERLERPVRRRG
jgi:signal peptidase I